MKQILFSILLVFVVTSCGKFKKDKDHDLTYYSEDYKEKDMSILNNHTSDIDAVWFEFSQKDKSKEYNRYSLIVKSNGEFNKEFGSCYIDWNNQITFTPDMGESYVGTWIYEKEKYTITYNLKSRTETLTFIYKETDKCKK